LKAWQPDSDSSNAADLAGTHGDDITFGLGSNNNASWDQFAANEAEFGVVTSFDEEQYTTKLDRSAPDFKEREKKAQRIANEIMGVSVIRNIIFPALIVPPDGYK
jgi:PAB1-binding protein PBP1